MASSGCSSRYKVPVNKFSFLLFFINYKLVNKKMLHDTGKPTFNRRAAIFSMMLRLRSIADQHFAFFVVYSSGLSPGDAAQHRAANYVSFLRSRRGICAESWSVISNNEISCRLLGRAAATSRPVRHPKSRFRPRHPPGH
jgi:hypothetical protein